MRAPDLQPVAAGVAALLLLASMAWWLLSQPEQIDPGQPTWKGADITRLTAAVPTIGRFTDFYVNDDNPFVPLNARLAENERRRQLREGPRMAQQPPPRPVQMPPPRPPVVVVEPEKPKLVLPKLSPAPSNAPVVYGLVAFEGQEALLVRMPGTKDAVQLVPGGQIAGWTLVSIDEGNLATFTDPQGLKQSFTIGQGDLAVLPENEGGGAKSPQGPATPVKGGPGNNPNGKGPMPNGARPGSTGQVDGPVPRPPPREEHRRPQKEQANPGTKQPVPPPAK